MMRLLLKGGGDFVVIGKVAYYFSFSGGGVIYSNRTYEVEKLLNNLNLLDEVQKSEFNLINNSHYDRNSDSVVSSIEIVNESYLKSMYDLNNRSAFLFRYVQPSEISSFYLLEVDIVVKGIRLSSHHYTQFKGDYTGLINVLGWPEFKPLAVAEVPDPYEPRLISYQVPVKDIDQIIAVKYYRDPNFIGKDDYSKFTGEKEEVVLDLNSFDMEVYQFFKDHDAVEIQFES